MFMVLGVDGVIVLQELRKFIDLYGLNGLNIFVDMMMKWCGVLLRVVEKYDFEYNNNVEYIWGIVVLYLIEYF